MCSRCDRSIWRGRLAVLAGLLAIWTTTFLLGASVGCNSAWSDSSSPTYRWKLAYVNQSNVAQVVTVSVGRYVTSTIRAGGLTLPAGGVTGVLCMTVKAGDEGDFYFGDPPSFVEVQDGAGKHFQDWTGKPAPNYLCPFWAWEWRFPSGAQQGLYPY